MKNIAFLSSDTLYFQGVSHCLSSPGILVRSATSLKELLALVKSVHIELVIMEEEGEDYAFLDVIKILYNKGRKPSPLNFLILSRLNNIELLRWSRVFPGSHILSRKIRGEVLKNYTLNVRHVTIKPHLTPRQWQVLNFLCAGIPQAQASNMLSVSPKTFSSHKKALKKKLLCVNDKKFNLLIASMVRFQPRVKEKNKKK